MVNVTYVMIRLSQAAGLLYVSVEMMTITGSLQAASGLPFALRGEELQGTWLIKESYQRSEGYFFLSSFLHYTGQIGFDCLVRNATLPVNKE